MTDIGARAASEIIDLHVLLQDWFCGTGAPDADVVLGHFATDFTMITPTGVLVTYAQFAAGFAALRGTRPGLVMAVDDIVIRHAGDGCALVGYRERQTQGSAATIRLSSALLIERPDRAMPVWRHLQETWQQAPTNAG
jgi:hypothetical protein